MYLETKYAHEVVSVLEDAQDVGMTYVVFSLYPAERGIAPNDLDFFDTYGEALDHWERTAGSGYTPAEVDHPVHCMAIDQLLQEIKQANSLNKTKDMNFNNLQNLQDELARLGFGKQVADDMRKQMEKDSAEFLLHDRVVGIKGQVDLTLYFKQSGQSENYYLNKYDVSLLNGKPLAGGEKYMVVDPDKKDKAGNKLVSSFDLAKDAIDYFKSLSKNGTLAVGKDWSNMTELARKENGNVNYIEKDFNRTYKNPGISQTFFVERGKGFTAEQAANLIQGRAVYRDDLVKLGGEPYKAWIKLDMDNQKDRYHNFQTLQYHVPTFGFDLEKTLDKFQIKELNDEKKREALIQTLEKGNRPIVTVDKDGEEKKLFMEIQPRYSQANFFREDGKPEKREQFMKEPVQEQKLEIGKGKGQAKAQEQGMAV